MFFESIKFYEHVEVLFKIYISDVITNVFEALRGNSALDDDNNIHYYHISRISRHVRYCAFLKKKLRTTRPKPKGKAVEKKEPLGSQSLTANIIAQFCKFVSLLMRRTKYK